MENCVVYFSWDGMVDFVVLAGLLFVPSLLAHIPATADASWIGLPPALCGGNPGQHILISSPSECSVVEEFSAVSTPLREKQFNPVILAEKFSPCFRPLTNIVRRVSSTSENDFEDLATDAPAAGLEIRPYPRTRLFLWDGSVVRSTICLGFPKAGASSRTPNAPSHGTHGAVPLRSPQWVFVENVSGMIQQLVRSIPPLRKASCVL
jgi:hypothetical protein